MILELHAQGVSVSAIAQRSGLDRKTVRKYIKNGLKQPRYAQRLPRPTLIDPYVDFVRERLAQFPLLTGARLRREIEQLGYEGGQSAVNVLVRDLRPSVERPFEVRFETAAGQQGQVDFAHFLVCFSEDPTRIQKVWLFSMVMGHSRYLWAQFVCHQDLGTVLRCHAQAFEHLGGAPKEILYDRMKTAVLGERYDGSHIVYNAKLLSLADHYGFTPKACQPYRAKTKGKVERPFRYIRADFFMGRQFANLADLNQQLRQWLDTVANVRTHGTTNRVVIEHFMQERSALLALPVGRFDALLRLERRVTNDGCVSVGGNLYSVPNGTRRGALDVEVTAHEVRISADGVLVATHAVLAGRNERSTLPGHRKVSRHPSAMARQSGIVLAPSGHQVARRNLQVYAAIAAQMSQPQRGQVRP